MTKNMAFHEMKFLVEQRIVDSATAQHLPGNAANVLGFLRKWCITPMAINTYVDTIPTILLELPQLLYLKVNE